MADSINLVFSKEVNSSIQVGDTVYKSVVTSGVAGAPIVVGECTAINATRTTVTCNINEWEDRPTDSNFMLFTKDNKANLSSLKGYYAEVVMKNNSYNAVELYSVGSEVAISSK
tara:strand:- start:1397 stop:1738 length:342 start_codon:yes stop_codon:yes gene_type:complete